MPKLTDEAIRAVFRAAFTLNQRWGGYVTWKPQAQENVRRLMPGITPELIDDLIYEHITSNGEIKLAKETRDDWLECGYHYDFVVDAPSDIGKASKIYVETVILRADVDDPGIHVVNCHPQIT
jgi:hypothetical protein